MSQSLPFFNENVHLANKGVGLLQKLEKNLPCNSLLAIYYTDVIYDQGSNASFSKKKKKKNESAQYSVALIITWTIKGSSCEKL